MTNLNLETSLAVSARVRETSHSLDRSIIEMADLAKVIAEANSASELAPAQSQKIYENMANSFTQIVQGRAEFVAAHKAMVTIKMKSDHAETDFGCIGFGPLTPPQTGFLKAVS